MSHTLEYKSWKNMIQRCTNPNCGKFQHYGGRGITVCDRWHYGEDGKSGFECFVNDVGLRPSPAERSLDRIDNGGNYEPGNVRWVTQRTQTGNTRRNRPGMIGVYRRRDNRFEAGIQIGSKRIHLGMFATAEAAHQAYLAACNKLEAEAALATPSTLAA
jgi:hypothetical protein